MKLYDAEQTDSSRLKACCTLEDAEDARSVAYRLGMQYYVFNFKEDFREQVIGRFVDAYERVRRRTLHRLQPLYEVREALSAGTGAGV